MFRIFGQGTRDDGAVGRGQSGKVRFFLRVLHEQLPGVLAVKRQMAREQLLKDDAETILVAVPAQLAQE